MAFIDHARKLACWRNRGYRGRGGGVNTASVEVAKFSGARVIVVGSNAKKLKMAESLGADIVIDRSKEDDWSKAVYSATNRRGADIVVDNVGITFPLVFAHFARVEGC